MKFLKLTFIALLISLTAKAQDATNDATWEETVEFIKKYKSYIVNDNCTYSDYQTVNVNNDYLELKRTCDKNETVIQKITFDKLYGVLDKHDEELYLLTLLTTGSSIKRTYYFANGNVIKESYDFLDLKIRDSEFQPRIYKAFEHLSYLATKKREEEHKSSGDKF
jgi:hypothetical protein